MLLTASFLRLVFCRDLSISGSHNMLDKTSYTFCNALIGCEGMVFHLYRLHNITIRTVNRYNDSVSAQKSFDVITNKQIGIDLVI